MSNDSPLISVLMPCFNSEKYIEKAINSILNQSYPNIELIICNDRSTDHTIEIVNNIKDDRIKVYENQENQGYLKTCNFLFSKAQGDYITFQDSDDYSELNRLELQLNEFKKNKNLGIVGTQFNFLSEKEIILSELSPRYPENHEEIKKSFHSEPAFCGASVMVKRKLIEETGTYNEYWDRIGAEDHYWLYVAMEKYEAMNLSKVLYYYRNNPNSVTRNKTNPRKIHCQDFLHFFIQQREQTGTDFIEQNDLEGIKNMERKFLQPYQDDPNFIYYKHADWAFSEQDHKSVFKALNRAILNKPFSLYSYKTYWYYLKTIYLKAK